MKKIFKLILVVFLCIGLIGCSNDNKKQATNLQGNQKVRVNGSTSMEKLVNGLAEVIQEEYPDIIVEPQFTGSSAGIEAVASNTADIGTSSRALKDEEKQRGIVENIVAIDGIVIITNPSNTIHNLTREQLIAIYTGKINNWQAIGGPNQQIVVIGREAGSGSRGAFEEILGIQDTVKYAQEVNETGAVVGKVGSIPGAIGYVALDVLNDTVKPLKLDGIEASEETIKDGRYPLQRPFVMATNGPISKQKDSVKAVFAFLDSEAGQELIKSVGLVSAK